MTICSPLPSPKSLERFAVILLDTHISVRWVDPSANPLSPGLAETIEKADQLAVSAITCWEVPGSSGAVV
jgi:PIN domain nuclease of toxin-antitoxin system